MSLDVISPKNQQMKLLNLVRVVTLSVDRHRPHTAHNVKGRIRSRSKLISYHLHVSPFVYLKTKVVTFVNTSEKISMKSSPIVTYVPFHIT